MAVEGRRILTAVYAVSALAGAFFIAKNASEASGKTLIGGAAGFLLTAVTQAMISEAIDDQDANVSAIMFVVGLCFFAMLKVVFVSSTRTVSCQW